jgi:3,4-dihydroxy-2-butanone 4-phosphate synthase
MKSKNIDLSILRAKVANEKQVITNMLSKNKDDAKAAHYETFYKKAHIKATTIKNLTRNRRHR